MVYLLDTLFGLDSFFRRFEFGAYVTYKVSESYIQIISLRLYHYKCIGEEVKAHKTFIIFPYKLMGYLLDTLLGLDSLFRSFEFGA